MNTADEKELDGKERNCEFSNGLSGQVLSTDYEGSCQARCSRPSFSGTLISVQEDTEAAYGTPYTVIPS